MRELTSMLRQSHSSSSAKKTPVHPQNHLSTFGG